jgi:hypothetical protein
MVVFDFVKRFFTDDFDTSKYIRQFYGSYPATMEEYTQFYGGYKQVMHNATSDRANITGKTKTND